ncbi:MAG: hypothetical protein RBT42_14190 [Aquabacterium sp.]|jgi:hypothetical protein|uniref:hypothetical protein n=1 Tax=Aquabacterium sp. TaxID=1872578 RepID=UPI002A358827|nr:hypothetical protein [Aquabacterium sp.]MDX9844892.1 hypothetical protein [Aquabacterium sp.]
MSQLVRLLLICLTLLILPLQSQAMSRSAHTHDHDGAPAHTAHSMPHEMQHPAAQAQALVQADSHCASGQAHCHDKAQTGADHGCGGAHCALCAALPHLAFHLPVIALNTELVSVTLTAGVAPPLDSLERPPQRILA